MNTETTAKTKHQRVLMGKVVSNKMDKTIVVNVVRKVRDKIYKKYVQKSKKFHAHDADNSCQIGDIVKIGENRPISKTKTWVLLDIVEKAK